MAGDVIRIELAGEPIAKGRPRFVRATGHTFTPPRTARYEDALRYAAQEAMAGRAPMDCPIALQVTVRLPVPASWSAKKRQAALEGVHLPAKRPDVDNYIKAAMDALNMIVWRDDSQIVDILCTKRYSARPALIIEAQPLFFGVAPRVPTVVDYRTGEVQDAPLFASAVSA